ncbi:hypothetical protein [Methylobacterium sp. E-045]|uniref:hypothetical protein n=1 Tax=Methylobacterium sp. E-045 TaxID=2836575 RepID=UPI001FB8D1BF|nr:hypothetical protein [Methylobacterium sp. E-045]MCJ2129210.1 hypothetical protein [Methylobacterium sp. E-045]
MSGPFPGFGGAVSGGSGGTVSVIGRGVVTNVGGTKTGAVLMGAPIHGRDGIWVENNDGVEGPITIRRKPDGVLMTTEGVDCSTTNDIELGMATQDGQDTYVVTRLRFWGATKAPTVLRGTVSSKANRDGVILVPATTDFSSLTTEDAMLVVDIPIAQQRVSRFARLLWKPTVVENLKLNITVYRELLRQNEVF